MATQRDLRTNAAALAGVEPMPPRIMGDPLRRFVPESIGPASLRIPYMPQRTMTQCIEANHRRQFVQSGTMPAVSRPQGQN